MEKIAADKLLEIPLLPVDLIPPTGASFAHDGEPDAVVGASVVRFCQIEVSVQQPVSELDINVVAALDVFVVLLVGAGNEVPLEEIIPAGMALKNRALFCYRDPNIKHFCDNFQKSLP